MLILAVTCVLVFASLISESSSVNVQLDSGVISGQVVDGDYGSMNAFRRIPYAKPPVGPLRFRKPERPTPWAGVLETVDWPPACTQTRIFGPTALFVANASEDCLYLNVWSPTTTASQASPVMVYIHGGANMLGSISQFGEVGIGNMVSKGVVFVMANYRLGPLGYLTTGDDAGRGNWGLHDNVAVLDWVQRNIASFGGNRAQVTLFGQSVGAVITSALTISPLVHGKIHGAIEMSGSAFSPFVGMQNGAAISKLLAAKLGCNESESEAVWLCLRQVDAARFEVATLELFPRGADAAIGITWDDPELFPAPLSQLLAESPPLPYILGSTNFETAFFAIPTIDLGSYGFVPGKGFTMDTLKYVLQSSVFTPAAFQHHETLQQLALKYYFNGDCTSRGDVVQAYSKLMDDIVYQTAIVAEARVRASMGWTVYLYSFDYFNTEMWKNESDYIGATHIEDVQTLFQTDSMLRPFSFTDDFRVVSDIMASFWTDFASSGSPSPTWPNVNPGVVDLPFMNIDIHPKVRANYHENVTHFWLQLVPQIQQMTDQQLALKRQ